MHTFRRLTVTLCTLPLLQLALLGGGTPCAVRGTAAPKAHDMSAMAGMATSGTSATPAASAGASERADLPPTSSQPDDGCRMPSAPGQCATLTACTMGAIPSAALVASLEARPEAPDLPMPGDLASRQATPPELPPPRA